LKSKKKRERRTVKFKEKGGAADVGRRACGRAEPGTRGKT
jgi:hypothetical protein